MGQVANKSALEADKKNKRAALLIILCWLVYTCSYIGKLGYNANITQIETLFGVTHAEAGMVSTFFFFRLHVSYFPACMSPSTYRRMISFLALVRRVMDLRKCPGNFPVPSYVTVISPLSPGLIGSFGYWGTVHPQEVMA